MIILASGVFGAPYSPTLLKLSAPSSIQYEFDGKSLSVPVTISGKPATAVFFVYTKDVGEKIGKVTNGYLGWHYVNKIDTCVHMSTPTQLAVGNGTISWNGKNFDDALVPAGTYTYYLWAFDSINPKQLACNAVSVPQDLSGFFECYDSQNIVLSRPIFHPNARGIAQVSGKNTRGKWVMGNDPFDSTMVETTYFIGGSNQGKICPVPGDHTKFFVHSTMGEGVNAVRKFTWVPNGQAEHDIKWGESDGMFKFYNLNTYEYPGPISDNVDKLWVICAPHRSPIDYPCQMFYVDMTDGSLLRTYDFAPLWVNFDEWSKGLTCQQGPRFANFSQGRIFLGANQTCMKQCIDPYAETDDEVTVWYNSNGDYVGDRNFEPTRDAKQAWLCGCGSAAGWVYDVSADANQFMIANQYDLGAVSFCLFGPDGRGVGNFSFAGETAAIKFGQLFLDCGSAYDGIYMDYNKDSKSAGPFPGLWFIGHDSIKGVISNQIKVEDSAPAAFSVAQNTPNPFNPSTTISFTLARAGITSVEVFNSAGQKVETLLNENLSAGPHSITWNASRCSAGVYFYTVSSGALSRTLKMTVLK
jgi:flagellar hook assembly protein FlgD